MGWYYYKTQDGVEQGYYPARSQKELRTHISKPLKLIKEVKWDGEEFREID